MSDVIKISAGGDYSIALKSDGTVVSWGDTKNGLLKPPANLANIVEISASEDHVLALLNDNTVVAWGDNRFRQSTIPAIVQKKAVAVSAGLHYSLVLLDNGKVEAWGYNLYNRYKIPANTVDVIAIYASYTNSVLSLRNGKIIVIGANTTNAMITRTATPGPLLP
jgi:alpha-tubulin suppressor-like RCC1 family protein